MFYFSSDDVEIAGASPETLAKLQNQTLYNFPLPEQGRGAEMHRRMKLLSGSFVR